MHDVIALLEELPPKDFNIARRLCCTEDKSVLW
jgi:hypothetical protein